MILNPKDISLMFHARDQVHLWHLQTKRLGVHQALGEFYPAWIGLVDDLIETDAAGEVPNTPPKLELTPLYAYAEGLPAEFLKATLGPYVAKLSNRLQPYPGLANIVADMQNLIGRTLYRLSLL